MAGTRQGGFLPRDQQSESLEFRIPVNRGSAFGLDLSVKRLFNGFILSAAAGFLIGRPRSDGGYLTSAEAAAWVGAVVTFLAVLVALFKEELVPLWRKPTLVARIRLAAPDCHKTELVGSAGGQVLWRADCYYLRLWVENTGNERAEKVQVFASRLSRRQADTTFKVEHSFLPMNLRWAHNQLGVLGPEIFAEGISPQMGKHCDLGHIVDPQFKERAGVSLPGVQANKTVLKLDLEVAPNTRSHLLPPGTYRLDLKLAAANCTPVTKTIEITHTGDWHTEEARMFADGIGMTELT